MKIGIQSSLAVLICGSIGPDLRSSPRIQIPRAGSYILLYIDLIYHWGIQNMTSEIEVAKEASVIGIGEKCGMSTSPHQDLPIPDCNGPSHHNQAGDLDTSYVFVTGTDTVGDVDVGVEKNTAKRPEKVSQNEKLDAVTGEVINSPDEERLESVDPCNEDLPVENDSPRKHLSFNGGEHEVVDDLEERTDKSEISVEPDPVEDPDVKNPSVTRIAVQEVGDKIGKIESLTEQEKYDDDLIKSESTPAPVANREPQVGALELTSGSPENEDLNSMSPPINSSVSANGGHENQNTIDECDNEINITATEKLQANQGSEVVAVNVIECESQDEKPMAEEEETLAREAVETAGHAIRPSMSLKLDTDMHKIDNREEMHNGEAMATKNSDAAFESNTQSGSEQRPETETVVSCIDSHVESVCDLILEGKNEESFASHVGSGIQHAEEPDEHPDGSGIPHETMHAESKTIASPATECFPTSSAHSPETENEISDAAAIETASSLPLDGTASQIIENGLPDHDSLVRGTTNAMNSGSGSTVDGVILTNNKSDGVLTEKEPTFQDDEAPGEAEVSTGLSQVADSQPAMTDVKLEPEVLVHNYSSISNGEMSDATSDTCRMEVLDGFNTENGNEATILLETEGVQNIGDQLDDVAGGSHEQVFLQDKEVPGKFETFDVILEPGVHVHDTGSSGGKTDAVSATGRTEVLDSFNIENESANNTALEVEDVQNMGDQVDGAAVGGSHGNMCLQENEATGKSEAFDVNLEPRVNVLNFSATSNGEKADAVSCTCRTVVLDNSDVVNEGVANAEMEIEDVQNHAVGDCHEKVILQENETTGNSETFDVKLEPGVHPHSFSGISNGEKTNMESAACKTEILDKLNVDSDGVANTELEVEDFQNTGEGKLDGAAGGGNQENLILQENEVARKSGSNGISGAEWGDTISNTVFREELSAKTKAKPFNFLVRVPRFDDDNLREQIRLAKLHVDEKTKIRDAIQVQIQQKRASSQIHGIDYEFAKGEGRSARKLVKTKRMEIDSLQSMINKAKNALSIDDIDSQIQSMEHMIQHETLPLKEEKQLIREIKQLKQLREQLSSNLGSQDEIKRALEQREEVEERLKILRKELDVLKEQVLKAEAAAGEAGKKYDDENKKVRELQAQFRAADDVRQSAYAQLQSLRKELSKKNEHFFKYKDAAAIANNYAFSGNKEALYGLCTENVKNFMELWNTDTDFRKEYLRCNERSTVRRLGTLDGRSLGPNEQPLILPSYAYERARSMISPTVKVEVASQVPIPELKQETTVKTVAASNGKSMQKVTDHKIQKVANKETTVPVMENGYGRVSGGDVTEEVPKEPKKSVEDIESIRKEEEMRREEAEAKLKEQRRLEALEKANEARERKKRRAEKLQMRAELKLQKEAEQKEKEREKRLRKKERKMVGPTSDVNENNHNSESAPSSESAPEIKETPKKPQTRWTFTKQQSKSKTIPPPLRNRNKRKLLQQWMWVGVACLILFLFWMGNVSLFSNIPMRHNHVH